MFSLLFVFLSCRNGRQIPYGVHHTKLFLVAFSDGTLRVVIHTANLIRDDIHLKTQGAYIQDFPLKDPQGNENEKTDKKVPPGGTPSCTFEQDLIAYIRSYGFEKRCFSNERTLCQELRRYDFSTAKVTLIPSTPGRHKLGKTNRQGYLKLSQVVQEHLRNEPKHPTQDSLICQFSSIGSLTKNWLNEFTSALIGAEVPFHDKLKLVFPAVEEVRMSMEGYRGGASVPGTAKNATKPFLLPLYCRWGHINADEKVGAVASAEPNENNNNNNSSDSNNYDFGRSRTVPHIKTYYALSSTNNDNADSDATSRQSMRWFVLTSHNLSKAAWGEKQTSTAYGRRLFIRHWELGVFLAGPLIPAGPHHDSNSTIVPLPYALDPCPYGPSDTPWVVDKRYSTPDAFGRYSVSD